ncbi:MAG: DUF481 domain-containing protein [Bdellovibrionaceae bacterium]|nr:DUF481 domain-containing protein [Pseudobdellovibrionaceae bacterium]
MFKQLIILAIFASAAAQAAGETFKGEAEASAIVVSGNLNSQTIGAKSKNTWNFTENEAAIAFGSYIDGKAEVVDSNGQVINALSKSWTAGLRYEHVITKDQFSAFIQHMAEADPYNGIYVQRNSTDIGAKYSIINSETLNWLAELGYRYSDIYKGIHNINNVATEDTYATNYVRGFTEVSNKFNLAVSGKLWFEYLQDTKKSDQSLWNTEASLSAVMTSLFSLKTAYLVKHNEGTPSPGKKDTTTWTTALVANY